MWNKFLCKVQWNNKQINTNKKFLEKSLGKRKKVRFDCKFYNDHKNSDQSIFKDLKVPNIIL